MGDYLDVLMMLFLLGLWLILLFPSEMRDEL